MNVTTRAAGAVILVLAMLGWGFSTLPAQRTVDLPPGRTLINAERAPLVYRVVDDDELRAWEAAYGEDGVHTAAADDVIAELRRYPERLRELAPLGMWPVVADRGVLIGYYAGGPSEVAYRLVVRPLDEGSAPVRVGAESTVDADGAVRSVSPWDLPPSPAPISLDGMNGDWEAISVVYRATPETTPDGASADSIDTVRTLLHERWWFAAVESTAAIADGRAVHLQVFPQDRRLSAGSFDVVIQGESGPVVFRSAAGNVTLAGQYVRRAGFLEFSIERSVLDRTAPNLMNRDLTFGLDTSTVAGGAVVRERLTTLRAREIFSP